MLFYDCDVHVQLCVHLVCIISYFIVFGNITQSLYYFKMDLDIQKETQTTSTPTRIEQKN
jgi:hypothetical protein